MGNHLKKKKKFAGSESEQRLMKVNGKFDAISGLSAMSGPRRQRGERSLSSGEELRMHHVIGNFTPSHGVNTAMNSETDNLRLSFAEAQKVSGTKGQLSETNQVYSERASSYNQ